MDKWYERNYRRNLVDMHIEDWDKTFMSQFDPEGYVGMLKKANVTGAMIYANSHVGLCYWPTLRGKMHSGLNGRDIFGEIVNECHKSGMDVIAYYTLIYDNWAYAQDPSWRILRSDGYNSRELSGANWTNINTGRYGVCCPNSEGYREYTKAQLMDLTSHYEFDGIFLDMTFWPDVCYCDSCKRRYEKEVGGKMPRTIDWNNPEWNRFQAKREEWLNEFAHMATDAVKKIRPSVSVNHQYSTITQSWVRGVAEKHKDACDYVGGDFYAGLLEQSFICKLFRSLTGSFEFHTSRCTNLGDHTTMKSKTELELQNGISLAHNGAFLFIDAIDPTGTLNPNVYNTLGEVFQKSSTLEPFLGGQMCQDVGILFDMESKFSYDDNGKSVLETDGSKPHLDAAVGAAHALKEAHIPYGVISTENLVNAIERHTVLVLPEVLRLTAESADLIREYVRCGGNLYISGHTDTSYLEDVVGFRQIGMTQERITYIAPTDAGQPLMPLASLKYPVACFSCQPLVQIIDREATVLAVTVLPYTNPTDSNKFASIHSNPPGRVTENPAILFHRYGKGKVVWVASPIEAMQQEYHKGIFINIIRDLGNDTFSFSSDAPPAVEIVAFQQAGNSRYIISALNLQELLPPVPVHDIQVALRLQNKEFVKAVLLPDGQVLNHETWDEVVKIKLPPLVTMLMFSVEYR